MGPQSQLITGISLVPALESRDESESVCSHVTEVCLSTRGQNQYCTMANHSHNRTCGASHCRRHGIPQRKKKFELNQTNKGSNRSLGRKMHKFGSMYMRNLWKVFLCRKFRFAFDPKPHASLRARIRLGDRKLVSAAAELTKDYCRTKVRAPNG